MKQWCIRVPLVLLVVLFTLMPGVTVCAEEELAQIQPNEKITAILKAQLSDKEREILLNTALYDESMQNKVIAGCPIIKVYCGMLWGEGHRPFEELLPAVDNDIVSWYIVWDDEPYICKYNSESNSIRSIGDNKYLPEVLSDVAGFSDEFVIGEKTCQLEGVYAFWPDAGEPWSAAKTFIVYFLTDQGIYVKNYNGSIKSETILEEEVFRGCVAAYRELLLEIAEQDLAGFGGLPNFNHFVEDYLEKEQQARQKEEERKQLLTYITIWAVAVVAVIAAVCIHHSRKKRKAEAAAGEMTDALVLPENNHLET